jgi:hypothetical protein
VVWIYSVWVNEALHVKVEHDQRLRALDEFVADHGEITEPEVSDAGRRARARAVLVRGEPGANSSRCSSGW